ncbi:acyltransferase family protein [Pseudonocardia sp. GCM10023141]|uniref:acyltransferase family protein n=1 Tax=Pseudonocardia sp. GCM10023141 TaxID=3252653 RepID=UPI00361A44F1
MRVREDSWAAERRPATTGGRAAFRPELQGLRAVAVALVMVYHVWLHRVSGGVDVFFVITGFLLTGQLARAAERGPLDLPRRWSRTVVRLVPVCALVLVSTAVVAALVLPPGRWPQTLREVLAAGLFLENWRLAADAVDYAARNNVASVVQHFWSLSIQGQFFLLWPMLIAAVALACRDGRGRLRSHLTVALLVVVVASLAYSVELTDANQPLAYFHSLTRVWEFAIGGLLALHIDTVTLARRWRLVLGWVGLVGLVLCGLIVQVSAVFPGVIALWPTGCAVLVLLAGATGDRRGADRFLAARPMRYLGDLSFALYLWHWPVLVLYLVARDREGVGLLGGAGVVALALLLAVLTHHLVEKPLTGRARSTRAGYRLGAISLVAVLVVVTGWQIETTRRESTATGTAGDVLHPGAVALRDGPVERAQVLPAPVAVYEDWVRIENWDCAPLSRFPMDVCTQPVAFEPTKRVVVVGDSHAQQLSAALIAIAAHRQWQLSTIVRGACPFSTTSETDPDDHDCVAWNDAAAAEITDRNPDAVVTLASRNVRVGLTEQTPPGFVQRWRGLDELGIPVLAIRDNPRFDYSMPDCIQQHDGGEGENPAACGASRAALYAPQPPWTQLDELPSNVTFLDIADAVCHPDFCPAEIGNVLVYLDDNHLSASYSMSMSELIEDHVVAAFGD